MYNIDKDILHFSLKVGFLPLVPLSSGVCYSDVWQGMVAVHALDFRLEFTAEVHLMK